MTEGSPATLDLRDNDDDNDDDEDGVDCTLFLPFLSHNHWFRTK